MNEWMDLMSVILDTMDGNECHERIGGTWLKKRKRDIMHDVAIYSSSLQALLGIIKNGCFFLRAYPFRLLYTS